MSDPFKTTPRFQEAARLINNVNVEMLSRIAKRICQQQDVSLTFTAEETSRLMETLSLEHEKLDLVLRTLSFIVQQAAFLLVKPAVLAEHLKACNFSEEAASTVSDAWALNAKTIVDTLKKESLVPFKVQNVQTSIHLQLSSQAGGPEKTPLALLHLEGTPGMNMTLQFTREQLFKLYGTLETIQNQLDNIV